MAVAGYDPYAGYAREIESINQELRALHARETCLKQQRARAQGHLYELLRATDRTRYGPHTVRRLAPKPPRPRYRTPQARRALSIGLLRDKGILHPERLYEELDALRTVDRPRGAQGGTPRPSPRT